MALKVVIFIGSLRMSLVSNTGDDGGAVTGETVGVLVDLVLCWPLCFLFETGSGEVLVSTGDDTPRLTNRETKVPWDHPGLSVLPLRVTLLCL